MAAPELLIEAAHLWCVRVDGNFAFRHEPEAHRSQAEFTVAHLSDSGHILVEREALTALLDEAIAQSVNLGALIRTDPQIKGTPMALELKLRQYRAALTRKQP